MIRILWPGKTKKSYYRAAIDDYFSRIKKLAKIEIVEVREENAREVFRTRRIRSESKELLRQRKSPATVLLDPNGRMMTSEEFAAWLEKQNTDVDFILGGPEGVQIEEASLRLSFGRITLPHELARVVLLEQIYRALAILHRLPYHK